MDSKPKPVYEDFKVHTEWVHEALEDTLIAYLPGFTKEELKVQVTTGGNLRIFGERRIGGNKFSRFSKQIPIPSNCDQNKIRADFTGGVLHIKHPKLVAKPSAEVPMSEQNAPRPANVPRKQSNSPEQAVQEAPPMATMEKQTGEETDGLAKEADKAPDKEKEMKDKSNAANGKTSTSEKHERLGDSVQDVAEKENVVDTKKLDGNDKYKLGINMVSLKYKQVVDGLAMGLKNPRKMVNMVLAVLLIVVLGVYLRNAIRSLRNY